MPDPGLTLVTGATGFVGSAVARALLDRGYPVRLLVRPSSDLSNVAGLPAEHTVGDLKDLASLQRAVTGCRYIVHVAADYRLWVPDPEVMNQANVDGTHALLRAGQAAGVERMVYCSSVAALGLVGDGTPADETTPNALHKVIGTYKRSKFLAEQAVLELARNGMPVVIVNPSAPVGPRDVKPTPTGKMIADTAAGRMPAFVDTGLNVAHVDDVALGHVLALELGRAGECYILGGEDMAMGELLGLVAEAAGRKPPRVKLPIPVLYPLALASEALARIAGIEPIVTRDILAMAKKKMFFSSDKARRELGYAPRPARDAVFDAVAWFRQQGRIPA